MSIIRSPTVSGVFVVENAIEGDHELFNEFLNEIPWHDQFLGAGRKLPRKVCGEDVLFQNEQIYFKIINIGRLARDIILQAKPSLNISTNLSVYCNCYRNGRDYTPFHSDMYNSDVIGVSFGATRSFHFKRKNENSTSWKVDLKSGSVIFFSKEINDDFQHSIPKRESINESRINLTFFFHR